MINQQLLQACQEAELALADLERVLRKRIPGFTQVNTLQTLRAAIAAAQSEQPESLSEEQVELLRGVPIFAGIAPDQFRWIVRRVEFEHHIGDDGRLQEMGITRLKDAR